jgi:inner membrane protein
MATAITHAFCAGALGVALLPRRWWPRAVIVAGLVASAADADVLGHQLGVPYLHPLGHRGLSHSLVFALALALVARWVCFRGDGWASVRGRVLVVMLVAALTHPLFDMLTDGGHGIALWAPFSNERLFLPWRPVEVAPLAPSAMLSEWGLRVMASELAWLVLPWSVMCVALGALMRRTGSARSTGRTEER